MSPPPAKKSVPAPRAARHQDTRARLLEAAGQVFAEKGFERSTAKEIAERAGTNAAAVNYHFGGIDALYAEVIEEARTRLFSFDDAAAVLMEQYPPVARLQALIARSVRILTGPLSSSWMVRVLAREHIAPSGVMARLNKRESDRRLGLVKSIAGGIMALPPEHPAVAYACVNVMAPIALMMIADRKNLEKLLPGIGANEAKTDMLVRTMTQYALGGLAAIAREAKSGTGGFK